MEDQDQDPDPDPVRVGSRGTIGSLMYRELECIRRMEQKNSRVSDAVSISCGRPLASLAGYRLGMRKQQPQDSNTRPLRSYDAPATPRPSNVEGRRSTCKMKRQESHRKSMSVDAPSALTEILSVADNPTRQRERESGAEFRTPMLNTDLEEGSARRERPPLVQVVDLGCKGNDKLWGPPIASRFRRLSFSRLSDSLN